jgi:hypothetical protein
LKTTHLSLKQLEKDGHTFNALYHRIDGDTVERFDRLAFKTEDIQTREKREAAIQLLMDTLNISELLAGELFFAWYREAAKREEQIRKAQQP